MKKVVVIVAGLGAVALLALWKVAPLLQPIPDADPAVSAPSPATTTEGMKPAERSPEVEGKPASAEERRLIAAVQEQLKRQGAEPYQEPGAEPSVEPALPPPPLPEGVTPREDLALEDGPDDPSNVTPHESKVLAMYEELVARIDRPELSCKRFEADFIETVTNHEPALKALHDTQVALPEAEREAARARLEHAARHQLARLRQSLRVGFAKCPPSESMKTELAKLATNNAM